MNILINNILVKDITYFRCNDCEVSLYFSPFHKYSPQDFLDLWEALGNTGRFFYNDVEDYYVIKAVTYNEPLPQCGRTEGFIVSHDYVITAVDEEVEKEVVFQPDLSNNTIEALEALMREI